MAASPGRYESSPHVCVRGIVGGGVSRSSRLATRVRRRAKRDALGRAGRRCSSRDTPPPRCPRRGVRMTTPRGPQPFAGQEKRLRLLAFVRQDSVVRVDKRVEDTAMVWPHLLVIEFIAAMLWSIGLFVIAAAFNAPLQDHATPDCTPNPSKAPWYLLNLQELLLLVLIVKRLYAANTHEWMIAIFTGFVAVYVVLTVVGTSMRGPGMDLFPPWSVPVTHQCNEPNI